MHALLDRRWFLLAALICAACGGHHGTLRERPAHDDAPPTITAEALFQIGLMQARRGDWLRAEQYFTAARDQGYEEVAVVYWLVRVCVSAGRYHSALRHAVGHLRDHPSNWRLRLVVASIYEALGDLHRARAELESIVFAEPTHSLPRYRLAVIYKQQPASAAKAVPHLEAYLDLSPDGPHAAEVRTLLDESYDATPEGTSVSLVHGAATTGQGDR